MATIDKIRLSGTTYDLIDSTAIHSLDGYWTTAETENAITAATSALAETIEEQHYATESYVQSAITEVSGITSGEVQTMIDNSISGKANTADVVTNVSDADDAFGVHINVTKGGTASTKTLLRVGSGLTWDNTNKTVKVNGEIIAQKTDIPSVSGYADAVKYNSTSKYVEFYHGGTGGTKVFEYDASPFLIDGMVQNVEIKDVSSGGTDVTCLVISFNTDAGKQDINIPISEIFDASNYYTKTDTDTKISEATSGKVDTSTYTAYTAATYTALGGKADTTAVTQAISEATSGKADTTAVTQVNNTLTAHTADTTIHVTSSDKTTWSGKQDALVSGTNIKTVNNNSLLGSGNIDIQTGLQASVDGTTLIFS